MSATLPRPRTRKSPGPAFPQELFLSTWFCLPVSVLLCCCLRVCLSLSLSLLSTALCISLFTCVSLCLSLELPFTLSPSVHSLLPTHPTCPRAQDRPTPHPVRLHGRPLQAKPLGRRRRCCPVQRRRACPKSTTALDPTRVKLQ